MNTLTFTIFSTTKNLPETWDNVLHSNIFLSKKYLEALESASPINMTCRYIAFYKDNVLVGKALVQCINLNNVTHLGVEEGCVKTKVRNFAFKNLCSNVLFLGNNMLTGQNAFCFAPTIKVSERINSLHQVLEEVVKNFKDEGINIHITVCKDFEASEIDDFKQGNFSDYYQLSTQPTMEFRLNETWKTEEDYINVLQKKYRDQYKRARKKSESISKQKFSLHDIEIHKDRIFELYLNVVKNAPFNTFILPKNHFYSLKKELKDNFRFYAYFEAEKLVGFSTLLKNGTVMDTYFLGYDDVIQKDKILYLNMLYDMLLYSIRHRFKNIVFGRTALEIKSSIGAKPTEMFGLIKHHNPLINKCVAKLFKYLEPKTEWTARNPFKNI